MLQFLTHSLTQSSRPSLKNYLRPSWFVFNFLLILLWSSHAEAARLLSWRFEPNQNQLSFSTDGGVQPAALMLSNPARLVIDLPGTSRGGIAPNQFVGGLIREVRVGQYNAQTTRIVVELAAGYTIDPRQVVFQPNGSNQWLVRLPQPTAQSQTLPTTNIPVPNVGNSPIFNPNASSGLPFQVTQSGFFLTGVTGNAQIRNRRSDDRRTVELEVEGASFPAGLLGQTIAVNRYGVGQVQFTQNRNSPSIVNIAMSVNNDAPDWQGLYNRQAQGLLLAPVGVSTSQLESASVANPVANAPNSRLAVIRGLELSSDRTQLLIRSDQPIRATGSLDANRNFRITIPNAQVGNPLPQPRLDINSPISRLQVIQQDSQTVVINLQPSLGANLGQISQVNSQLTALNIFPQSLANPLPPLSSLPPLPPQSPISPISPIFPINPPNQSNPSIDLPAVRGRQLVVIDPGHGGRDPGAVGIGGLRESGIVIDISQQVADLLEQQGVQVRMTRTTDVEVDLAPRVNMANQVNATVFVSIHANAISMSRPEVNGVETFYFSSGRDLAASIQRSILEAIPEMNDRRARQANFYVLRNTRMPAALVEVGFVTGAEDAPRLRDPAFRSRMAAAIARGILRYIQ